MPYSKEHKQQSRERILDSALRLFAVNGFDQVTIDRVMREAGLTRGAFYAHFDSKQGLYAEAILHGIHGSALTTVPNDAKALRSFRVIVETYLSRAHADAKDFTCPLAFFARDVGARERKVRDTYTVALQSLSQVLKSHLPTGAKDEHVLAMTILMVGGIAVSSTLTDGALKDRVLSACRGAIMDMARTRVKAS